MVLRLLSSKAEMHTFPVRLLNLELNKDTVQKITSFINH